MTQYRFFTESVVSIGVPATGMADGVFRAVVALSPEGRDSTIRIYDSMVSRQLLFELEIAGKDMIPKFVEFDVSTYPDAVMVLSGGRRNRVVQVF